MSLNEPDIVPGQKLAYSVAEATALTSLKRSYFYELINQGRIETIKVGRRRVVTHAALVAFLESCKDAA